MKRALIVVLLVIVADQVLKIWVKTHFQLGEYIRLFGPDSNKAYLQFVENDGMAFGLRFGGSAGKPLLTLFRIVAVVVIGMIMRQMARQGRSTWQVVSMALIFAGALGNIIDSAFYGILFDKGTVYDPVTDTAIGYKGLAAFGQPGYASFLHGSVVDMFYFPLWQGRFPDWLPIWGGTYFEFFKPVFNIADAAISVGVVLMLLTSGHRSEPEPASAAAPDKGTTPADALAPAADAHRGQVSDIDRTDRDPGAVDPK